MPTQSSILVMYPKNLVSWNASYLELWYQPQIQVCWFELLRDKLAGQGNTNLMSKEQNFHLYYSAPVNNRLKIQLLFHIHSILAFSLQNAPTPLSGHLIVCIRHMWKRKATQRKPSKCSLWPSTKSDRLKSLFLTKLSLKGQKKIQSLNQAASHFFAPVLVSVIL